MRNRLFAVICVLLALAMLPGGASARAKKAPKKDIGIQLYSVRSLIGVFGKSQGDYKPVLKQLADMGYTSVEAASYKDGMLYGQTPEQFRKDVEAAGMKAVGVNPDTNLVEVVEIENHPWFIGTQYHPEYKSTVLSPSPLFVAFVKAALAYAEKK